jgi:hypothetical protein
VGGGEFEVWEGADGDAGAAGDAGFAIVVGGVGEGIAKGDCLAGQLYEECLIDVVPGGDSSLRGGLSATTLLRI